MTSDIEAPTLDQLGDILRELLDGEPDTFRDSDLLFEDRPIGHFFRSAVMQQAEEQVSQLPDVANFFYDIQKQRWHIEVKDLSGVS